MWAKVKPWIEKNEFLLIILSLVVALRIPSLLEPYWYGDEGIYLTIGQALRRGLSLYKDIHDNKPPLLYWVAALAGGGQFWFKFLTLIINLGSVLMFWKLANKWWSSEKNAFWSTLIFALLTTLPLFEGNIANAELFFLLPTVSAFYLLLIHRKSDQVFLAGVLFGIAALFKMPAFLEIGIWPIYWLVTQEKNWLKKSLILGLGGSIPIVASILYYQAQGSLPSYLVAAGLQNVPYLSSWQAVPGIVGSLKGRAIVAVVLIVVASIFKKRLGKPIYLLSLWWVVTLFSSLLSGRPYPHYLLQVVPSLALGIVFFLQGKSTSRVVVAGLMGILILSLIIFKFYVYPIIGYYTNFLQWSVGQKNTSQYYDWFNKSVNRNYQIAKTVADSSTDQDTLFIWGDEPMIYALARKLPTGKYTAKYHIQDFSAHRETLDQIRYTAPRYIVTFSNQDQFPGLIDTLEENYELEKEIENAQVYRRNGIIGL